LLTPYKISFIELGEYPAWDIFEVVVDGLFALDMFLTFFTSYYEELELVSNFKSIACKYLKFWFWIDLLSVFPFEILGSSGELTVLFRILRIQRLNKLLRIRRLFSAKNSTEGSRLQLMAVFLKLNPSSIRFSLNLVGIIYFCHLMACFWNMIDSIFPNDAHRGWLMRYKLTDNGKSDRYLAAFYWIVQTVILTQRRCSL
jgi:hypothetical protein